jgi:hypothetical protein
MGIFEDYVLYGGADPPQWANEVPAEAPPGVTQAEYDRLNPAEKRLMHQYHDRRFNHWRGQGYTVLDAIEKARVETSIYYANLAVLAVNAEIWSVQLRPFDDRDNSPRNAFKHAFWMCTMSRQFGEQTAYDWGQAHETVDYWSAATRALSQMDLHNNHIGRLAAREPGQCHDRVLEAGGAGAPNRLQFNTADRVPKSTPPVPPPPPPPPADT